MKIAALLVLPGLLLLAQPPQYELLLKGGHVIDPKNGIDGRRDVAIRDGRIAEVAPTIPITQARKVLDVEGLYVTPGLVDIHVHLFASTGIPDAWAGDRSVYPDGFSFRSGVTTMVDAGSAGWRNFDAFRHSVIDRAQTRVLAMVNIAGYGMMTNVVEQGDFDPEAVARVARKHRDVVVGVKTAHYEAPDWTSVDRALEAGKLAAVPVMVDFGYFRAERPYWKLVTERLRPGDISTHAYLAPVPFLDDKGALLDYLRQARARGVKFDVGHGAGSFVFRNAVAAVAQGFYPDSISTDLHTLSMNGAMMDMLTTMSKFLAMGMPLREVIHRSCWVPAQMIRREELGHLTVGAPADLAVLRVLEGKFAFADVNSGTIPGNQRLLCEVALKDGRIAWDWNARAGVDYRTLGPGYGIREGIDFVVIPK